jgi:hypothetical protein
MAIESNKVLAARLYFEVFGSGNLSAADEILAPDCVSHAADQPPRVGTDGINGRIVESWFIPDRLALWQQLGLI